MSNRKTIARLDKYTRNKEQGFTLVELLVTILIIGILVAIAIMIFTSQRKAAVDASLKSDLKNAGTLYQGSYKNGQGYDVKAITDAKLSEGNVINTPINGLKGEGTFCLSGYNLANPDEVVYYDNSSGGLSDSAIDCASTEESNNENTEISQPVQCHPEVAKYFSYALDVNEYQLNNPEMQILTRARFLDSSALTQEQLDRFNYHTAEVDKIADEMYSLNLETHPDADIIMAQIQMLYSTKYSPSDPEMSKLNDLNSAYIAELRKQSVIGTIDNPEKMEQIRQEAFIALADYRQYLCSAV